MKANSPTDPVPIGDVIGNIHELYPRTMQACIDCGIVCEGFAAFAAVHRCGRCADAEHARITAAIQLSREIEAQAERTQTQARVVQHGLCRPATLHMARESLRVDQHNRQAVQAAQLPLCTTVWLYGPAGTGKTFLARQVLAEAARAGQVVAEIKSLQFLRRVRDWEEGEAVSAALNLADLLLFDDVDKPRWNESGTAALWRLLDDRYESRLRTIVTSNVSPADFAARNTSAEIAENLAAALDRLQPMNSVHVGGPSRRRQP